MHAKNREKIQPLGHFSDYHLGKNCDFVRFDRKIKNESRLSQNATKLYRQLYKNTYSGFAKFRRISNKDRFILIFRPKRTKSQLML